MVLYSKSYTKCPHITLNNVTKIVQVHVNYVCPEIFSSVLSTQQNAGSYSTIRDLASPKGYAFVLIIDPRLILFIRDKNLQL